MKILLFRVRPRKPWDTKEFAGVRPVKGAKRAYEIGKERIHE